MAVVVPSVCVSELAITRTGGGTGSGNSGDICGVGCAGIGRCAGCGVSGGPGVHLPEPAYLYGIDDANDPLLDMASLAAASGDTLKYEFARSRRSLGDFSPGEFSPGDIITFSGTESDI